MDMDVNTLRIAVTVAGFVLFIALVAHSWSRRRTPEHSAAAMLPFVGEEDGPETLPEVQRAIAGDRA
jgi:cbb3-type cytochrome oxidase subunit 3